MYTFSKTSKERLATCHPELKRLFKEVAKYFNCSVLCGHRNEADQNKAFAEGMSKLSYPLSKHNRYPSIAVDVAPYPIDWDDMGRFYMFVGFVRAIAIYIDVDIRCGADWDGDWATSDQNLHDLPHFELKE